MLNRIAINRQTLTEVGKFLRFLVQEYVSKGCRQQAAALTYMTLFALVPLLTVAFTMFSLFPAFEGMSDGVRAFLFMHLLPDTGLEIQQYLTDFTQQARSLTMAGVPMLLVTAFLMIKNIEIAFNDIWNVKTPRKGLISFLIYWAILSLGPLLLGVGLAMSTYLLSLELFVDEYDRLGIVPMLLSFFPWFLSSIAFTLLFVAVPNCRVPLKHAFWGALVTAVFFELCKDLFGWIVSMSSIRAVYGAFAIVPLFLMWVYLLWMIVLVGALFVRTLSSYSDYLNQSEYSDLDAALVTLWFFYQSQQQGRSVRLENLQQAGVELAQWHRLREAMLKQRIIVATQDGNFVLCRDLRHMTLEQLVELVGYRAFDQGRKKRPEEGWFASVAQRLERSDESRHQQLDVSIAELFAQAEPHSAEVTEMLQGGGLR